MARFRDSLRANLLLAAVAALGTLLVLTAMYELRARARYQRWRAKYQNDGWLGRLTVASANPELLWEYRPYGEAAGIATNRYGFRDVDYPTPAKPAGTYRVVFVGDSVTLGIGVHADQTFVRRVGALAADAGRAVQSLSVAVDGYHALQVRELLAKRALLFEPDRVVYVMCPNDFDFSDSSGRKIAYFRQPTLFVLAELERRFRVLRQIEFHQFHFQKNASAVFEAVSEMQELALQHRARFMVALAPVFAQRPAPADYFAHYPLRDLHRQIREACAARGIRVHDLLEDFERAPAPPDRYALDIWHLSPIGHRLVAESLFPLVVPEAGD